MEFLGNTFKDKIDLLINNKLFEVHTSNIAIVKNINYETQRLDAQIAVNPIATIDGKEHVLEYPILRNIPFQTYQGGDFAITIPPKIGDTCLLVFCERNADAFWTTGNINAPTYAKKRKHDINDAIAIVGFNPKNNLIPNYNGDNLEIRNKNKEILISLSNDAISVKAKKSTAYFADDKIEIKRGNHSISITDDGIYINTPSSIYMTANNQINLQANNISINASNQLSVTSNDFIMNSPNSSINSTHMSVNGAVSVRGDLDVNSVKLPQLMNSTDDEEPTPGYLYTGVLDEWNTFVSALPEEGVKFTIVLNVTELTIAIEKSKFGTDITNYVILANSINEQSQNLFTCQFDEDKIVFTTTAKGSAEGYISYLHDITENIGASHGTLYTGTLQEWDVFKASLNNKGLAFKINSGGTFYRYEIKYNEIEPFTSFTDLATHLNGVHPNNVAVQFVNNSQLVFATIGTGSIDGIIGYLQNTDTTASPAKLYSNIIDVRYSEFVQNLNGKNYAFKLNINNNDYLFYILNEKIISYSNFSDFIQNLFINNEARASYSEEERRITIETVATGEGTTIGYCEDISEIPAQKAYLITGTLPSFASIKSSYSSQELNLTCYIVVGENRYDYVITPQNLLDSSTWGDIANLMTNNNVKVEFNSEVGRMIFTVQNAGLVDLSYLQYEPDGEVQTIDASMVLMGTSSSAFSKFGGANKVDNIAENCAEILKLTEATEAVVTPGKDDEFNSNSAILLDGVKEYGAVATSGKDGKITILNNSATLLRGTQEEGAKIIEASDTGEVPVEYDGIITLVGDVHVTNELKTRICTVTDAMTATGDIELNPTDPETKQIDSVVVNGGINAQFENVSGKINTQTIDVSDATKTKDLLVSNKATVDKLVINNGVEITGDVTIDGGNIVSNGTRLSFKNDGMHCNKDMHAPDVYVND